MKVLLKAFVSVLILTGCTGSETEDALGCSGSAVESTSDSNDVLLTLSCSGGGSTYTVTSITLNGEIPDSINGTVSSFTGSTTLTLTDNSRTSFDGLSGSATIYDAQDGAKYATVSYYVSSSSNYSGETGCSISLSDSTPNINQSITFTFTSNSYGSAAYYFSNLDLDSYGAITTSPYSYSSTVGKAVGYFTSAGTYTVSVDVEDANGELRTCSTSVTVNSSSSSSGSLSCNAWTSPSTSYRGQSVQAAANASGASGSAWVYTIRYPSSSGMSGYFINDMTAMVTFSYAGTFSIQMVVYDQGGASTTCTTTHTVY